MLYGGLKKQYKEDRDGIWKTFVSSQEKEGTVSEETAEKLGVSRQTISKWETDETLPDIRQAKRLADGVTLDELIDYDLDVQEIQEIIDRTRRADREN